MRLFAHLQRVTRVNVPDLSSQRRAAHLGMPAAVRQPAGAANKWPANKFSTTA
jgi:hypothetical protein